jgi:hypothetical protein
MDRGRLARMRPGRPRSDAVYPHRAGDVLQALLADVLEGEVEPAGDVFLHPRRDANAAGLRRDFEPRRDIDPIAKDVAVLDNNVALVDADAVFDAPVGRHLGIALGHRALHFDGAAHRIDDAREFDEEPVAGGLDDAAPVLSDLRIAQLAPDRLQRSERAFLVVSHRPRIAGDIGRQNRRQPAFDALALPGSHPGSPLQMRSYRKPVRNDSELSSERQTDLRVRRRDRGCKNAAKQRDSCRRSCFTVRTRWIVTRYGPMEIDITDPAERMRMMREQRRRQGVRELRLFVPDARSQAVRSRVAAQVAALSPGDERDALLWIEAVSEFDADQTWSRSRRLGITLLDLSHILDPLGWTSYVRWIRDYGEHRWPSSPPPKRRRISAAIASRRWPSR